METLIMEDHGKIITHFETMFGENIDHEVIKMILQACEWDTNIAYEQILNLIDPTSCLENRNEVSEIDTTSSVVKKNASDPSSKVSISVIDQSTNQEVISNKIDFIKKLILENKKFLIIMRGLPGSGKSSLAKSLNRNGIVLSTDDYFYDKYKNYNYNPNILPEAHNWNKDRAKFQIYQGVSPIFIDNTNLQLWEFEPYIRSALQNGYYVDILEPKTVWKYDCNMLSKKCIHNIPKKKIMEMKERFETFLSIDDILKKLKLSNNMQDIEVDYARSLSRNSDPDIVIEEDSADTSEEESSSMENVKHTEERCDQKIPDDVFEDIIDNFQKLLIPKKVQHKDLSEVTREFAKSSSKIDRAKDEAMYKLCSDIEDKMGKPFFSSRSTDEEKVTCLDEFPDLIHTKKDLSSQINNLTMEDYSCITASDNDNLNSWDSQSIERENKNHSSSNSSKPQRIKKSETSLLCNNFLTSSSTSEDTEDEVVIDWDSVSDKSKLSWENNSSELPMGIHGAIPKRLRNPKLTNSSSPHVKFKKDNSTQYQTADYSSSNNDIKIIKCNPSAFIPYPLIDIKENEALTKTKLFLDKSTMTSDLADYEKPSNGTCPLKELKSFFPDLSAEDLKDFLEKCDYDIDWTMNLLIDSGYKISSNSSYKSKSQYSDNDSNPDIVDEKSATLTTKDNNVKNEKSHLLLNFENDYESSDECSKDEDKYSLSISSNSLSYEDEDSTKEGPQYLTMEIDKRFASQLINLFGPISSNKLSKGYTKEDCKIVLPLELCHDIYKYWSKTLEGKFQHETDILDMFIREDEELARKLQEEENAVGKVQLKENVPSFQEIVEMQKSEVSNAKLKASKETTCASMLSLQKLQEEFGHVDPTIVEDEYCNQNFDYSSTKTILAYKYGNSKSIPKTIIAPGTILLEKDEDSSDEEEEENYEDFSIAVDDPQMYRDEAQLHYLEGKKALKKAQDADQKGMKSVASYYAQIRNMHMQKFNEANDRASKKILDAVNSGKCPNTLDLHLLHVDEALREAQKFLSERRGVVRNMHLKEMQVTIITGKGKHSANGARLKPAIQMFLKNENYSYSEYSGHFKVTLKSQTRL